MQIMNSRIDPHSYTNEKHWGQQIAEEVIRQFPDEEIYTCAAGISPSGTVHFGNFRDVITALVVSKELAQMGKKTRVIFSWDDFDRMRKVPSNVAETFAENIGKPLAQVPDPETKTESYARHFEIPFEKAMQELSIDLEYRYQSKEYSQGTYTESIKEALGKRKEIAEILLSFMTEKGKEEKGIIPETYIENYYPISVYSRFSGKDNTKIISYDGAYNITYTCFDTNQEDTIDIRTASLVKLQWKVDWPMRWRHEGVVFEPGGHDHASPGSSYDIATVVAPKIFNRKPPVFAEYKFVGIQGLGAKMSGSKGNAVSPLQLLEIYEPEVLKWLYMKKTPAQAFTLAFDSEIYRQYEEFDKEVMLYQQGVLDAFSRRALELALSGKNIMEIATPIPFRQAVALGQIVQWDKTKLSELLSRTDVNYSEDSLLSRIARAQKWLLNYNPGEMIVVCEEKNTAYWDTMSTESQEHVRQLARYLREEITSLESLEQKVYALPKQENLDQKENAKLQRAFFKDVYNLLISRDTGPRLSTFIWALGTEKVRNLLEME